MSLSIVRALDHSEIFPELEKFVIPHEKFCSTLYEKILMRDEGIYALCSNGIQGVFCFSRGHSFVCCIPKWTGEIKKSISSFLSDKEVFCVHGEESDVLKVEKIIDGRCSEKDCRDMFLMEYGGMVFVDVPAKAFVCDERDTEKLMGLQKGFCEEEVLPSWKKINLPSERMSLDRAVKNNTVYAVGDEREIFTKANISMYSNKVVQISGVYTKTELRGQGYACALVNRIALIAQKVGRQATLLVRQENMSAFHAYRKAGFEITGTYRVVYFH